MRLMCISRVHIYGKAPQQRHSAPFRLELRLPSAQGSVSVFAGGDGCCPKASSPSQNGVLVGPCSCAATQDPLSHAPLCLLAGILSMIIIRTLRKDIANYNKEDDIVCGHCWGWDQGGREAQTRRDLLS